MLHPKLNAQRGCFSLYGYIPRYVYIYIPTLVYMSEIRLLAQSSVANECLLVRTLNVLVSFVF